MSEENQTTRSFSSVNNLSCIVLAAGRSKRMGEANKLLLPIDGKLLVRHTVEELSKKQLRDLIVVTGHDCDFIELEIHGLGAKSIFNNRFEKGMHSSIRAGIGAMAHDSNSFDLFGVCSGDSRTIRR